MARGQPGACMTERRAGDGLCGTGPCSPHGALALGTRGGAGALDAVEVLHREVGAVRVGAQLTCVCACTQGGEAGRGGWRLQPLAAAAGGTTGGRNPRVAQSAARAQAPHARASAVRDTSPKSRVRCRSLDAPMPCKVGRVHPKARAPARPHHPLTCDAQRQGDENQARHGHRMRGARWGARLRGSGGAGGRAQEPGRCARWVEWCGAALKAREGVKRSMDPPSSRLPAATFMV